MRAQKSFLIAFMSLFLGFSATTLTAQQAREDFSTGEMGAGADLVVTSVTGPAKAFLNQTISVTCNIRNQGAAASGAYQVALYLLADKTTAPATGYLLKTVVFAQGLAQGVSKKIITKVVVPNYHVSALSGRYYYGAVVTGSKMASVKVTSSKMAPSKRVSILRYSLADDNDSVTDHQTDLVWQRVDDGERRNWVDANQYCGDLVLGGAADWRLPRIDELGAIGDYARYDPAIDPMFTNCQSDVYWSSSFHVGYPYVAWGVNFYDGHVGVSYKSDYYYVRCVRGGPVPVYTLPGAPTGVSATAGNTRATVVFTPPASDGESTITSYTVTSSPGNITMSGISSPITVTGLSNGTAYTFTVAATNAIGTGPPSRASNSVTPRVFATRYSDNGDGAVADTNTGLIWQKSDDGVMRDWDAAGQYCADLDLGGHNDWRLPRIDELKTIVDFSRRPPTIDPVFDVRTDSDFYWSSSTHANTLDDAWGVTFSNGLMYAYRKTGNYHYLRCVRGGPFWSFDPSAHLQTPSGKPGTVLDTYRGYMWQKGDSGNTKLDWAQANDYCDNLVLDGYSDWRLPEIEAFVTIADYTRYGPALSAIFNPRRSDRYWSSSIHARYSYLAWGVDFYEGKPDLLFRTSEDPDETYSSTTFVRCVRGGQ